MIDEEQLLLNRFRELGGRAYSRGIWVYSDFLNISEQAAAVSEASPCVLYGGYEGAERKIACFGSADICGRKPEPPVCCVLISPTAPKFARALTHRDFLGALLGLGIDRRMLGDIMVSGNSGYLICLSSIADFIISTLEKVSSAEVCCTRSALPAEAAVPPEASEFVVASERLDAVTSGIFPIPRSESKELVEKELILINGKPAKASEELRAGDTVSVRGYGRYVYLGTVRTTQKGKLRVSARVYGKR